jgi:hypothetical protein
MQAVCDHPEVLRDESHAFMGLMIPEMARQMLGRKLLGTCVTRAVTRDFFRLRSVGRQYGHFLLQQSQTSGAVVLENGICGNSA